MAQLVALMSGVVLGGVAEVVGSNLARGKIFTASFGSVDSLYPFVYIRHAELRKIPVSGHIADCSDQDPKYFVFPFYLMKTESIMKRKEKEKYFIRTFLPKLNSLY